MEQQQTPSWGITPVPERLRVLGLFDLTLLWGNLSVSLLVIVAGAFLVLPVSDYGLALSLPAALGFFSDGAWALVAGTLGERLRRSRRFPSLQRYVSGSVFVGLGALTAAAKRH